YRSARLRRCCCRRLVASFIFFFHAEDGIRDRNVTGVQTCALPISLVISSFFVRSDSRSFSIRRRISSAILFRLAAMPENSSSPKIGRASCRERVYIPVGGRA